MILPDDILPGAEQLRCELEERGYVVLPGFFDDLWLSELRDATQRQFEREGDQAGAEFRLEPGSRRLANLVNKGDTFRQVVVEPRLLALVVLLSAEVQAALSPGLRRILALDDPLNDEVSTRDPLRSGVLPPSTTQQSRNS